MNLARLSLRQLDLLRPESRRRPVARRHWTFSIPRVLRGLFERERSLLSLLSQTAYASILKSFQALLGRKCMRPGCVLSIQTCGLVQSVFQKFDGTPDREHP
jgi:hypothetical protein